MEDRIPFAQRAIVHYEEQGTGYRVSVSPADRLQWRVGFAPTMVEAIDLAHRLID